MRVAVLIPLLALCSCGFVNFVNVDYHPEMVVSRDGRAAEGSVSSSGDAFGVHFTNDDIEVEVRVGRSISLSMWSPRNSAITIDWSRASIVRDGRSEGIVPSCSAGKRPVVSYRDWRSLHDSDVVAERDTVSAGDEIRCGIYPRSSAIFQPFSNSPGKGFWHATPLFGGDAASEYPAAENERRAREDIGRELHLVLPVEVDGDQATYDFAITLRDVTLKQWRMFCVINC